MLPRISLLNEYLFQIIYHLCWCVAIIALSPLYIYRMIFLGKYRGSTKARLGIQKIPDLKNKRVIWLHSVSLGESQISAQFAKLLKHHFPNITLVASSCTETGQAVLVDSEDIDFSFYYPIDINPLIKQLFNAINPCAIFIMETDLWPSMLKMAKEESIPTFLLNGKISENTFLNYQRFPFLKKVILEPIEHIFSQCHTYDERFNDLGVDKAKTTVTGNIKLDREYHNKTDNEINHFAKDIGLQIEHPIIVFASSHVGEELGFINIFKSLACHIDNLQCVFVPRHPERFLEVEQLFVKQKVNFHKFSDTEASLNATSRCLLVDRMGVLMDMYSIATIAVVAGSFTSKVGGHNIFEPAFYSKPIVYGPWIFKQPGLHDLIQEHGAAKQIIEKDWQVPLEDLLSELLKHPNYRRSMGDSAFNVIEASMGIGENIIKQLKEQNKELFY